MYLLLYFQWHLKKSFHLFLFSFTNKQNQNKTVENPKLSLLNIKGQIPSYNTRMQIFLLWTSLQGDHQTNKHSGLLSPGKNSSQGGQNLVKLATLIFYTRWNDVIHNFFHKYCFKVSISFFLITVMYIWMIILLM